MQKDAPASLDQEVMRRMRRCGHLMYHHYNLNGSQMRILLLLRDEPMTQKALTEKRGIQPGSISEILTKVERAGLIEKRRSQEDRRNFVLSLTDAGRAVAEQYEQEQHQQTEWMLSPLSPEQKQQLKSLLDTLITHWEEPLHSAKNKQKD